MRRQQQQKQKQQQHHRLATLKMAVLLRAVWLGAAAAVARASCEPERAPYTPSAQGYWYASFAMNPGRVQAYGANLDCYIRLSCPSGQKVELRFQEFDTEARHDYLDVYEGTSSSKAANCKLKRISGDDDDDSSLLNDVTSSTNHMWLHFHSDSSVNDDGFEAQYGCVSYSPGNEGDTCISADLSDLSRSAYPSGDNSCGFSHDGRCDEEIDCSMDHQEIGACMPTGLSANVCDTGTDCSDCGMDCSRENDAAGSAVGALSKPTCAAQPAD